MDRAEQMREAAAEKAKAFTSKSLELTVTRRDGSEVKRFDVHQVLREVRAVAATIEADIRALPLPPAPPLGAEVAVVVERLSDHDYTMIVADAEVSLRDLIERLAAERDRYLRHLTAGAEALNEYKARAEKAEVELDAAIAAWEDAAIKRVEAEAEVEKLREALDKWMERCGRERAFASSHRIRAEAAEARELAAVTAERIEEPSGLGAFVGDIWFGHPVKRTMGTHKWDGSAWVALPSEVEALMGLLADARARAEKAEAENARLRDVGEAAILLANAIDADMNAFNALLLGFRADPDMPVRHFFAKALLHYAAARKLVHQPYMGQIMAECDCQRRDECQMAGRCIAEGPA